MKIYVKCKDKSSQRWIPSQKVSIVGDIPKQVNKTDEVSRLLVNGVLVQVDVKEYERANKKKNPTKAEKLEQAIILFNGAISEGDYDLAFEKFKEAKKQGLKAEQAKVFSGKLEILQKSIEAEKAETLKKEQDEKDLEEKKAKATAIIESAIEKEVITMDGEDNLILGEAILGKEVEQVIDWVLVDEANLLSITDAIKVKDDSGSGDPE